MSAQLQVFAEWLLQVAMVIGGLVFVAMCLFGVVDLLSSCVAGALKRGDAWSKITYYFAHKRRIDGWAQELRDWEMLRDELKSAMERNAAKSNTIRKLHLNLADMTLTAGDRKAANEKLQHQLEAGASRARQLLAECNRVFEEKEKVQAELEAAVEHCAAKQQRIVQLLDEGSQRIVSHEQEKAELGRLLETAWGIIANSRDGGDWAQAASWWREAAVAWRDQCHALVLPAPPAIDPPEGCTGAGNCHGPMKWCDACGDFSKTCKDPDCAAHSSTNVGDV